MRTRLLLTRPEEDATRLRCDLEARGFAIDTAPLLSIQPLPAPSLLNGVSLEGISGLLVTSANGLRAFTAQSARRDLTVYAVGEASARAATAAGFADVQAAGGDVVSLAALVREKADPAQGGLLHVAGETLAGDLKGMLEAAGFQVARVTLYRAEAATALPDAVSDALQRGEYDGVLFFSPRTAATFAKLAQNMASGQIGRASCRERVS
jgi:uroporphyrinogen-III synthase